MPRTHAGFLLGRYQRPLTICAVSLLLSASASAGPWRADQDNTRGWDLMTPQERIEHQARMRGFTDYAACQAYRAQHHAEMAARARERGLTLPDDRGGGFCERLRPTARE